MGPSWGLCDDTTTSLASSALYSKEPGVELACILFGVVE